MVKWHKYIVPNGYWTRISIAFIGARLTITLWRGSPSWWFLNTVPINSVNFSSYLNLFTCVHFLLVSHNCFPGFLVFFLNFCLYFLNSNFSFFIESLILINFFLFKSNCSLLSVNISLHFSLILLQTFTFLRRHSLHSIPCTLFSLTLSLYFLSLPSYRFSFSLYYSPYINFFFCSSFSLLPTISHFSRHYIFSLAGNSLQNLLLLLFPNILQFFLSFCSNRPRFYCIRFIIFWYFFAYLFI